MKDYAVKVLGAPNLIIVRDVRTYEDLERGVEDAGFYGGNIIHYTVVPPPPNGFAIEEE